LYTEL